MTGQKMVGMVDPRNGSGKRVSYKGLSWIWRTIFYGICSFYYEVVWTALYDYVVGTGDLRLRGYSSIWSVPIYACSLFLQERVYFASKEKGVHLLLRGLLYMITAFSVELLAGLILFPFNANSWDYSRQFEYHFYGMIALEYAPLWYICGCLFEYQMDVCNSVVMVVS